ncbi:integrase catalytic domain-containing protein [Trichonephila clavipes]|nr:integrase catalytic domain-containing protein [Trichonephila clavipes]
MCFCGLTWYNCLKLAYEPSLKKTFFAKNRITKILNLTSTDEWHHIPGKLNPADGATRGLSSQQLMNADYWWKGPDWINNDLKEELASAKILTTYTVEADSVLNSIPLVVKSNPLEPISKFSNFTKLIRVIALCKRFINNCKSGSKIEILDGNSYPYAPNFGGLWESSIKQLRGIYRQNCKEHLLSFEELSTLLYK